MRFGLSFPPSPPTPSSPSPPLALDHPRAANIITEIKSYQMRAYAVDVDADLELMLFSHMDLAVAACPDEATAYEFSVSVEPA